MKLDDFLAHPAFSKYTKEVSEFRDEFINEGCEMFLWTSTSDLSKSRNNAAKAAMEHPVKTPHPSIVAFIEHLSSIDEQYISFIYPEDYSPKFLMAQEISKNAIKSYVLDNIFEEDDTKNWISIFDPHDIKSIGMMYHIVYSGGLSGDTFGGVKLFGRGLMYYAECLQYKGHPIRYWNRNLVHFQGISVRRDTNPKIILESRRVTQMLVRLGYFNDEYEILYNFWKVLLPFLQDMYIKVHDFLENQLGTWRDDVKQLQSQMVADGIIVSKWKSEQSLFTLVKKLYPDALFQFRPRWLEPQNLDIYIPSMDIGIEYQGIQHYESIDFFGGEEAFAYRQKLDARKRDLCKVNGLKLVAWPYTEAITETNLKKHLYETTGE